MKVGRRAQKSMQAGTVNWVSNLPGLICEVKIGDDLCRPFKCMLRGLRQGVLSPIIFSLYMNSLEELRIKGIGVMCRGRLVPVLLYVAIDDMILLAESENDLSKSL